MVFEEAIHLFFNDNHLKVEVAMAYRVTPLWYSRQKKSFYNSGYLLINPLAVTNNNSGIGLGK